MRLIGPLLVALTLSLSLSTSAFASPVNIKESALPQLAPQSQHATEARRIAAIYTRTHYVNVVLNSALSKKIFKRYLNQLDYHHDLFLQSDLEAMDDYKTQLDDDIASGQLSPFYKIFNLSLKRRYEQLAYSLSLLNINKPLTFKDKERYQFDRTDAAYPKDKTEQKALWKKKVKFDALNLKLSGKKWPEIVKLLSKRYNYALRRLTQTESEDVFQTAMNAFSRSIDPHTSYLSPRSSERFNTEMSLSLQGIGAVLENKDEYTTIRRLIPGGPAAKSGLLKIGDRIVGVAQDGKPMVDVIGWRIDDIVDLIKGPKGTTVYLQILPAGSKADGKTRKIKLVRDVVRLKDRAASGEVMKVDGHKIGVLTVPSFYVGLSKDSAKAINKLKKQHIQALVVDLRGNGGGALSEAISMTGLFIPKGPVVQVRDQLGRVRVNQDMSGSTVYRGPLVVLVNQYSASASEIFAAALQDYGRAIIVGEQTYGKGTVQQHRGLGRTYDLFEHPMGHVQYTVAKFYRVNGGSTQRKGVMPDIIFPSALPHSEVGESANDNALPWDHIKSADYHKVGSFKKLLPILIADHKKRIAKSPEFQYIIADIKQYQARKDKKSISLNYQIRKAQREKQDKEELARLNERLKRAGKKPVKSIADKPANFKAPDAYLDEATDIAEDLAVHEKK
ncbi:carboxy terminal-processing peptidase [Celerinatantimonas diazotrophica]|uniref:S41A family C-terminal processing peptidase-1 n=1 Tax=Celerinatantimonas diazotrophica TaxID=412034 RepID=A0A4R1JAK2_9GAMM|nr:carboxy terminal-processing peptidase [Celerinatantimonas diazotrophica]TCK47648.1 S41A family C-terminal processing peptidase-1 [Celerinatantimonas diazotrophica]CAG9296729.1 Tail-specific protease [Celerinatantimonas diazotrophica]